MRDTTRGWRRLVRRYRTAVEIVFRKRKEVFYPFFNCSWFSVLRLRGDNSVTGGLSLDPTDENESMNPRLHFQGHSSPRGCSDNTTTFPLWLEIVKSFCSPTRATFLRHSFKTTFIDSCCFIFHLDMKFKVWLETTSQVGDFFQYNSRGSDI